MTLVRNGRVGDDVVELMGVELSVPALTNTQEVDERTIERESVEAEGSGVNVAGPATGRDTSGDGW